MKHLIEEEATSGSPFHLICMYSSWGSPLPFPHKSVCFPYFLLVFYGWWGSSLIHLDSRWIHCTFPGSCLVTGKKKEEKKSLGQREHARGGVAWSAELRRIEWKTFPFLSLSVFMHPLFPHPGSKPWIFEKERKKKTPSFSLEWFVIMLAVLQWRGCAYTGRAPRWGPGTCHPPVS